MTECPLFGDLGSTRVDWTVTGLSGARVWKWGDAEALWQAESGDVLKTRESGGYAVSATLGGRIAGGINFAAKASLKSGCRGESTGRSTLRCMG